MQKVRFALVLIAPWALLVGSPGARAAIGDACEVDADCGAGLACEIVGGTGCACPSGGECEPCESEDIKACVPGPCATDADCGAGLVCVTFEVPCANVSTPDCPPGVDCGSAEDDEARGCEDGPETASICAPRWVLPCEAAADCGAGFTCEPIEICECSGGGGTPTDPGVPASGGGSDSSGSSGSSDDDEGGARMPPPEEDCTCAPGDSNQCRPIEVACDDDADCAEGWSCDRAPVATTCAVPEGGDAGSCDERPAEPGPGVCQPAGWYGGGGRDDDFGVPTDAQEVAHAGDGGGVPNGPEVDEDGVGGNATTPSSGCGGAPASSALALALAGLALALRRRRA